MTPIILLHHNEPIFLEKCINSIENNTKSSFEIIVVDNKSNDQIIKIKSILDDMSLDGGFDKATIYVKQLIGME